MIVPSREEYDMVRQTQSNAGGSTMDSVPLAELTRRFDVRAARMNDGTKTAKIATLRTMTGQVANPPIASESF